ncbi:SH3-like domain-containing protein [Acuticoccus sp.]|uniref:SH3-like domain-containing protein n=1 Tax=Acuticoccus sp. TaxID=1904378 RepID=UPI003B5266CF
MSARFAEGDRVRVADRSATGHVRTPLYLRGRTGVVARRHGAFANPETLAYGGDGLPKRPLYEVRFPMADVWGEGAFAAGDTLTADLYEHWLELAP